MIKRALFSLIFLCIAAHSHASPELLAPSEVQYGPFQYIETIEVHGNIEDSVLRLIQATLENKQSDFYVIQDISEDTRHDTLTVVINLYNQGQSNNLS
ncbi:hypothetical protein [Photobacterium atrarenae]|uniref:DUF1471 domain-containing protein n=1 Tax=Photobacterium atrarenae TaxID=865757 RepID=A0ABY5GKW2_9GAMM|nr:hypothetical protein [Photobacterium atrarenae]UTV29791.1 hypothetical protein NNL38_22545 [Photobacterium atrarenae]